MDRKTSNEPLLTWAQNTHTGGAGKKIPFFTWLLKWVLKAAMWSIFVAWVVLIFLFPTNYVTGKYYQYSASFESSLFGRKALTFSIFTAPILAIAVLGFAYIVLSGKEEGDEHIRGKKSARYPRFRLWTFPVLVDGPFGVVSAAEVIGIVLFTLYVMWAFYASTMRNLAIVPSFHMPSREQSILLLELTGLRLGMIGIFCLGFLFLPVSRGSLLLRLVDIPFEHATRYHVWLGHLTMALFALHGLFYVIGWSMDGRLIERLTAWENEGIANLPGVVSLLAGLFMWVTSLPGVRRRNFELFFYTHQLYVVFVVFLALHVGDFIFCFAAGGIFLFMLDRFLRFFQSRRTVDVLSARSFPCGTVELVLSKPANLHYNALGWIFLQIRELSWLQWHPFSVSSSPLDGKHHMAILIKVLGDWTEKLERRISGVSNKLTASVEGPYGHESPYHLTYENLILVAGGIGISPFLAIVSDVLRRIREGKPCLPKNILIIWAVKTSEELPLLHTLDMESICPNFSESLSLEIQTYVTRQSEPSLEEGKFIEPINAATFPASKNHGISVLTGTGNVIWSGIYLIASTAGVVTTAAVLDSLYTKPYKVESWWYKGLLLVACMAAGVLLFGGAVIGFWHLWERRECARGAEEAVGDHRSMQQRAQSSVKGSGQEQYTHVVRYGKRPNFKGIFESMSEKWGNVDIGVIICGPPSLQTSVARECRTQNLKRGARKAVFHFNSHSFDL